MAFVMSDGRLIGRHEQEAVTRRFGPPTLPAACLFFEQADVDKIIAACIAELGEVAFSDAYDEGQKMSLEEAVAYALQEVES